MTLSGCPAHNGSRVLEPLFADEAVLTKTRPGTKKGVDEHFNAPEHRLTPDEAEEWLDTGGNYGFALGPSTGLVTVDVEEDGVFPDEAGVALEDNVLLEWESGHVGRNRLVRATPDALALLNAVTTQIDLDGDGEHEVELLTNGHALGPGSVLDHERCKPGKAGCPGEGYGEYELVASNPEAEVLDADGARALLDALGLNPDEEQSAPAARRDEDWELPEVDESLADVGEAALRALRDDHPAAFDSLVDMLQGGVGNHEGLLIEDGRIDRSLQELMALTRLHETVVFLGHEEGERARAITRATFERYVTGHTTTDDGQTRKWLQRGEAYKRDRLHRATRACNRGSFRRFANQRPVGGEWQRWTGDTAKPTYAHVNFALDLLTGNLAVDPEDPDLDGLRDTAAVLYEFDLDTGKLAELLDNPPTTVHGLNPPGSGPDPECATEPYPTKAEVTEVCQALDEAAHVEGDIEAEYGNVLSEFVGEGGAKLAYCPSRPNGDRYVYYPKSQPDPDDARWVRYDGEKHEPEATEAPEPDEGRLMTDGGEPHEDTNMSTNTDMTETQGTAYEYYEEAELRERFDTVVQGRAGKARALHLPDPDSDDVEPMCDRPCSRGWRPVDVACFPEGQFDHCEYCVGRLADRDEKEAKAQRTGTPEWVAKGNGVAGNALEKDWPAEA